MVKLIRDIVIATMATIGLTLALSALVTPASAQASQRDTLRQACAADVRRVCPGVMPGGGRIQKCFVEKYDQVSPACKSALDEARALKANGAK
ncbi:MAG TPA: hypothetical protein VNR39_12235 [Pseudolabrys sp.]|nr:hypothetical protein [Pseudolabrys sp.]